MAVKKRPERKGIMLAYPTESGKVHRLGSTFICQPKFRGQRGLTTWFQNEPYILSSYQNQFFFIEHILQALIDVGVQLQFDGELYNHNWSQQYCNSVANRTTNRHPDSHLLEYHIYDIKDSAGIHTQSVRIQMLEYLKAEGKIKPPLYISPYEILTENTWQYQAKEWVDEGYEGIILRRKDAYYIDKRSVNLLKFKPSEEDEYTIADIYEAIDQNGNPKGMVGGFTVYGDDLTHFNVGAGKLKHEKRIEIWENRHTYPGRILIVKHEPIKTDRGVPQCAVAVEVKE
jgi:hypothetical protein